MLTRTTAIVGLLLGLIALPAAAENVVLARVDGVSITLDDLKEDFQRRHQGHMSILSDEEVVRDFLDAAIKRRLFIEEGRRMNLHQEEEIIKRVAAERIRVATQWLYESEVAERSKVRDADVEAAMFQALQAHEIIHIRTDTLDQAERARERIVGGEVAEVVAREVSTARSRIRGGLEGVDWGALETPFEEAIAATEVGEIAGPIETGDGWELAVVVARKDIETGTAKRDPSYVRTVLERRKKEKVRALFLDGLHERYAAEIDENLLEPAVLGPLLEDAEALSAERRKIVTFDGGAIELSEFAGSIRARAYLALPPGQQKRQASQLLANQVDEALLRLEAARRWSEAPSAKQTEVAWFENDLVFRTLLGRLVFGDIEITDEEIEQHVESHPDEYVEPAKVRFGIALLPTEEQADTFLRDFRDGTPFETLARERSQDNSTASQGGDAGWISSAQAITQLRGAPFESPIGAAGGPISLQAGWLVYTVLDRKAQQPYAEDKAREKARSELTRRASDERMKRWEEQLREVAEIRISDKGLRKAGRILERERVEKNLGKTPSAGPMGHGGPS